MKRPAMRMQAAKERAMFGDCAGLGAFAATIPMASLRGALRNCESGLFVMPRTMLAFYREELANREQHPAPWWVTR